MEMIKEEVLAIEQVVAKQSEIDLQSLDNLQLAMIGGGHGDIILG